MPSVINYGKASNRKNMAARRQRIGDGVTLTSPDGATANYRRIDGIFVLNPPNCELAGMVEDDFYSEFVHYIKNTSGGSWTKGTLLTNSTSLTASGSATATNISAGSGVTITLSGITGTIEVGSLCSFTDSVSPFDVQYAICTASSGSTRTFDELKYDMTTPAVAVIPAMAPSAATNASGGDAAWVVTATIANNGYAFVYGAARVSGIDTSAYSAVGSKVYLGTAGAATPTIPTSTTTTGQRVGIVEIKHASTGAIRFYPYRRIIEKIASSGLQPAALTSAHLFVGNGSGAATDVAASGDLTLANTGAFTIANSVITNAKVSATAAIDFSKLAALPSTNILVGSGTSVATAVAMSGDATLSNTGALTIAASAVTSGKLATSAVVNSNVAATAAIDFVKLAALPATNILVGSATSVATAVSMSGDATLSNAGVLTIATSAVTVGKLATSAVTNAKVDAAAAIAYSKLALTGSIVNADITNATIDLTAKVTGVLPQANGGTGTVNSNRSAANSGAVANTASITVGGSDSSYEVSGNVNVTASTTHSFNLKCDYTDETSTSRSTPILCVDASGVLRTAISSAIGVMAYAGLPMRIRAKAATSITISTSGTFTTVTYNVEGRIAPA